MQHEQTASKLLDLLRDTDPLPLKAEYRSNGAIERGALQFLDPSDDMREYYVIVSRSPGGVRAWGELIACEAGLTIYDEKLSHALNIAVSALTDHNSQQAAGNCPLES